jgi:dolichol kinase
MKRVHSITHNAFSIVHEFRNEFVRKSIHFLIALTPALAGFGRDFAAVILVSGSLLYIYLENLRLSGIEVPFFSAVIRKASRPRDDNRFTMGPVTLAAGALLALFMLPEIPATIAIYALAFGDGFASLVGRVLGRIRPDFLLGKSLEGSLACFFSVTIASWYVCRDITASLTAAAAATLCEALPLEDYDNIVIPLAAGFAAKFCLAL